MNKTKPTPPVLGTGCTDHYYTDRKAATIVAVMSAKHIRIRHDEAIRTDKNGMSESQSYKFEIGRGEDIDVRLGADGVWRTAGGKAKHGRVVTLGERNHHWDPSF